MAGCSWLGIGHASTAASSGAAKESALCPAKLPATHHYFGLAMPSAASSVNSVKKFATLVGASPNMVAYYATFGQPFDVVKTCDIAEDGALPLIQLDPDHTAVAKIGAGYYNNYISNFAAAVKQYGDPVVISFAHEMNGDWYSWGYSPTPRRKGTPASAVVSAWRQIHNVFAAAGATNVIWLWTPNVFYNGSPPLSEYYPGNSYVDWVGLDGYFWLPRDTFQSVFGQTLQQVSRITSKPVLIAETGITKQSGNGLQVASLFHGARTVPNILGFVYFDWLGTDDWRLENDPRALAAFRNQVHIGLPGAK